MPQRLQKIIAAAGYCSRRKAEELISAGLIKVDGQVAILGDRADPMINHILVDGKLLRQAESFVYALLNKPVGTVTTLNDPEGRPVVTDLVRDLDVRLFPVGRLDINTSGLLLLTNDGSLANQLAHPRHQVDKIYLVKVRGRLGEQDKRQLEMGVLLDDGLTAPAHISDLRIQGTHSWFTLTIHEGRNRQVRRMCEVLGYQVSRLVRVGYAFLRLDGLNPGQHRLLTKDEVERLKNLGKEA